MLQVTDAALGQTEDPYDTLWRAIFWTAIGLVAVTAIVIGLSTLFIFLNWSVPVILQSPRPQLMMLIIAVPSVAQACAGKLLLFFFNKIPTSHFWELTCMLLMSQNAFCASG